MRKLGSSSFEVIVVTRCLAESDTLHALLLGRRGNDHRANAVRLLLCRISAQVPVTKLSVVMSLNVLDDSRSLGSAQPFSVGGDLRALVLTIQKYELLHRPPAEHHSQQRADDRSCDKVGDLLHQQCDVRLR